VNFFRKKWRKFISNTLSNQKIWNFHIDFYYGIYCIISLYKPKLLGHSKIWKSTNHGYRIKIHIVIKYRNREIFSKSPISVESVLDKIISLVEFKFKNFIFMAENHISVNIKKWPKYTTRVIDGFSIFFFSNTVLKEFAKLFTKNIKCT